MHAKNLSNDILQSKVFYLEGEDFYWKNAALDFFCNLINKEFRELNIKIFNKLDKMETLLYSLSSFGFSDEMQIIIVKDEDYKATPKELTQLREVLSQGIEPYVLIFDNVDFLTAKEKKLMTEISCERLDKYELSSTIENLCKPFGGIENKATGALIEYSQQDMSKISNEIKKLISYCDGKRITFEDVDMLVTEDSELQVFQFVNSLTAGDITQAEKLLDKLLKRGEARAFILASLIKQYRRILHSAISPKSDLEISKLFGVKEYAIKKSRETKNYNKVELKKKLDMLISYEYKFKSGEMSESLAFDAAVSRLIAV